MKNFYDLKEKPKKNNNNINFKSDYAYNMLLRISDNMIYAIIHYFAVCRFARRLDLRE